MMGRLVSKRQVDLFTSYGSRFGLLRGSGILAKLALLESLRPRNGTVELTVPTCGTPITLRCGTRDIEVFEKVFVEQEYEFAFEFNPALIIDAGAHAGYATLFFANKYPNARIIAVEPEKSNFDLLQKNVRGYRNVTALQAAVWNQNTSMKIDNPNDDNWAFRVTETDAGEKNSVQAVTIGSLIATAGAERADIVKLDIEGAEKTVFASNYNEWLSKVRAIVIELHDWMIPGCSTVFYRATSQYSFNQFQKGENLFLVRT